MPQDDNDCILWIAGVCGLTCLYCNYTQSKSLCLAEAGIPQKCDDSVKWCVSAAGVRHYLSGRKKRNKFRSPQRFLDCEFGGPVDRGGFSFQGQLQPLIVLVDV